MNELERLNQDKYFGALYNAEEEQEKLVASAKSSGFDEGMSKGHDLGVKDMIVKMHKQGVSIEILSKATDLSIEEVESIINENK